ncbi:MAG: DUF4861 family protein [Bacteroidales bacterium]|nr:DUF4861 family protein [Bacteroidales bacterium]
MFRLSFHIDKQLIALKIKLLSILLLFSSLCFAQNNTEVSLFLKSDSTLYLNEITSEDGDLFRELAHHGPAIENKWLALRIYFDHKCAIDIYSKTKEGLELKEAKWYPTPKQQKEGWGADYYKVGKTVGLGGVRLWDGKEVINLNPVTKRTARVVKEANQSYLEMLNEGVPYKGKQVDILVRITVFSSHREAKVEAFALSDEPVQFVTGINYHKGTKIFEKENYIATWGIHPEDVATEDVALGGAIVFDPDKFEKTIDDGSQKLLISKPTKYIKTWITSANSREDKINNAKSFMKTINSKR